MHSEHPHVASRVQPHRDPASRLNRTTVSAKTSVLALQRGAGNAAVSNLLTSRSTSPRPRTGSDGSRTLTVQRHSSFEHALMGDVGPESLGRAVASTRHRNHVLLQAIQRLDYFAANAARAGAPRQFPDVRWLKLQGSDLWVTYGEVNALADYLPGPGTIDGLDRATMIPVLQRMRQTMRRQLWQLVGLNYSPSQAGAGWSWLDPINDAAGEVKTMDSATECLCTQRYGGLLARNACHFAPFSWQRWARFHEEARAQARHAVSEADAEAPITTPGTAAAASARQAWLSNGYGDHFLQDSFAAGHLINKTLVMQWFAEFLSGLSWAERPWYGVIKQEYLEAMTTRAQPGLAARPLYSSSVAGIGTATTDRETGFGPADPQTAEERTDRSRRVAASGVGPTNRRSAEQAYQIYLQFLNNSFVQGAAGEVHNYFNREGLEVENDLGTRFRVGGDNTLLTESNSVGAMLASQAAHNSQAAILAILNGEEPAFSAEEILQAVPTKVIVKPPRPLALPTMQAPVEHEIGRAVPLEEWHDDYLRQLCFETIFPAYEDAGQGMIVRALGATLVDGGVSQDVGIAPEPTPSGPMGDFTLPASGSGFG